MFSTRLKFLWPSSFIIKTRFDVFYPDCSCPWDSNTSYWLFLYPGSISIVLWIFMSLSWEYLLSSLSCSWLLAWSRTYLVYFICLVHPLYSSSKVQFTFIYNNNIELLILLVFQLLGEMNFRMSNLTNFQIHFNFPCLMNNNFIP